MITSKELFEAYKKKGWQNFLPTKEEYVEQFIREHPALGRVNDRGYIVEQFKSWVEDNNAFETEN